MDMILTPTDHLSPPSTTSRLSDSDTTSECDIDGITASRDGASISSLGSSSSPPPEVKIHTKKKRKKKCQRMMGVIFFFFHLFLYFEKFYFPFDSFSFPIFF